MADKFCEACITLQDDAPDFVQNGVTSGIATRLKNDQGFSSKSSVDTDCEALNLANDCLVGFMEDETESYDVCDWKTWSARFAGNVHKVFSASIAAICGLWSKVHNLLSRVAALEGAQSNVCDVLNGVTDLVVGEPQRHVMTTLSNQIGYRENTTGTFYVMAEKKNVTICDETVRLQGLSAIYDGPEIFFKTTPQYGMVLARISRTTLVDGGYMDADTYNSLRVAGEDFYQLYGTDGSIIQTRLWGDSNYPNDLVIRIRAIIGASTIRTGQSTSDNPSYFNRSTPPVRWTKLN